MTLAKTNVLRYVFFALILFEAWHAISHAIFFEGKIQQYVIHILAYNISFSILYALLTLTKTKLSTLYMSIILLLLLVDIYVAHIYGGLYMIITGFMLFTVILTVFYIKYPTFAMYFILALLILLVLVINESINCKAMLETYPSFPFHVIIESYGFVLFYVIGSKLLSIEA